MPNKEGRWVTIHGRAIFIGEGQSLEEAMNSKGQVKKAAGNTGTAKKKSSAPSYGPKASNLEKGMKIKAPDGEIFTVSKVEKNGSRVYVDLKKKDGSWYSDLGYDADEEVLGPFGAAYYKNHLDSWKAEKAAAESGNEGSKGSAGTPGGSFKEGQKLIHRPSTGGEIPVTVIREVPKAEVPGYLNANAGRYYEVEYKSKALGTQRSVVWEGRLSADSDDEGSNGASSKSKRRH